MIKMIVANVLKSKHGKIFGQKYVNQYADVALLCLQVMSAKPNLLQSEKGYNLLTNFFQLPEKSTGEDGD